MIFRHEYTAVTNREGENSKMTETRLKQWSPGLFKLQLCCDGSIPAEVVIKNAELYAHYYNTCQMQPVYSLILHPVYVSVFAGPTNVEDPVQLLMKDAGESKASLHPAGLVTAEVHGTHLSSRCTK